VPNTVVIDALHGDADFIPLNYLLQSNSAHLCVLDVGAIFIVTARQHSLLCRALY